MRAWDYSTLRSRTCRAGAHTQVSSLLGLLDVVSLKVLDCFSDQIMFVRIHPTKELLAVGEGELLVGLQAVSPI